MRLINARTLKLEEFWGERSIPYTILSHRWEDGEVTFQDMQDPKRAASLNGFTKIRNACELTVKHGYDYVWVDTCCINKESSAELSEAINSMYKWYQASSFCYAFLSDVNAEGLSSDELEIKSSLWFTRGWTLQELLAPPHVLFYDRDWRPIGTKYELRRILSTRTGIDEEILKGEPLSTRSIAQRMSWAAQRVTKRVEDEAYCLLGIFDVNMPMLYGEGEKAFLRLQEEIIKRSDDHSIFAWPIRGRFQPGLLADRPAAFLNCQAITTVTPRAAHPPYSITNRGLFIKLTAIPYSTDTYLARLDCADGLLLGDKGPEPDVHLGIFLRRLDEDDQYAKVLQDGKTFLQRKASHWDEARELKSSKQVVRQISFNVRQQVTGLTVYNYRDCMNGFRIATAELLGKQQSTRVSAFDWDPKERIMFMERGAIGAIVSLEIKDQDRRIKAIQLSFNVDFDPVCLLATERGLQSQLPRNMRHYSKLVEVVSAMTVS